MVRHITITRMMQMWFVPRFSDRESCGRPPRAPVSGVRLPLGGVPADLGPGDGHGRYARRLEAEYLSVEGQLGLERGRDRLGLAEAVRLAIESDVRIGRSVRGQVRGDALGLRGRDDRVVKSLQ